MRCIICGTEHDEEFCPNCGARADIGVEKRYCPSCGASCVTAFCPVCGAATVAGEAPAKKRCPNCGAWYDSNCCPNCGYGGYQKAERPREPEVTYVPPQQVVVMPTATVRGERVSPRSRWVAFFLCMFLGVIGVHRFYVGKIASGLLYLFTGGFFGVGYVVDLLAIALGSFRDANGDFLTR